MNSKTIDLNPERWSKVEDLFDRAANLDASAQVEYLETACRGDNELRNYILDLLRASPSMDAAIGKTIVDSIDRAFADDTAQADDMRGEKIGPYQVVRLIGSGGMGMVYLAERADQQYDQQVAIKLGRHRLVDPETIRRLRNERQILADLDHPNIARLFDGGTTEEGVPYLVMEYIDGTRIDTYCDLHRLNVVERLKVFQTICAAVHYAHQNLVIHRDIKAANILVATDGTPKLLDFGIAKLIDSAGEAADGLTREGAVIMTPANATPEQILRKPVTTATDVYALGLLLHTLLSGHRAYETESLSPTEWAHVVCQQDVVRPSLRLRQISRNVTPGDEAVADNRSTSIVRLQRQLRGDLDTIVLNALRKEPARRYRSVSALADDIGLHLKSMPIVARSDSWRYRAGKFVRRHYVAVAASVLVVAMLAVFSVVLSVQNRSITKERDTAREVSRFLEDIFMSQDPAQAKGAKITAAELLAAGADRIQSDLGERPEIQSTLMGTIGRVYYSLGEFEPSAELLEQALQLQLQAHGENHPDVAAAKNDLATTLIQRAEYSRAEDLLESALQTNRNSGGPALPQVAANLENLADLYVRSGDIDRAEASVVESLDIYSQLGASYGMELAEAKATLARTLQVQGDLGRTETLLLEAIKIVENAEGDNHPEMAYYLQNLGVLQRSKGDLQSASETLEKAVAATRRILGEKHDLLAATLIDQGVVFHLTGDFENANRVMREALALYTETRGNDHPAVGYTLIVLGMLQHDMADLEAAENSLREAFGIFEEAFERDHQYTASTLTELGAVLNSADRPEEAQPLLQRALEIRQKDYSADHELVAATRTEYADAFTRQGQFDTAEPMLLKSFRTLRDKPGRRNRRATKALARFYELSGRPRTEARQ